MKKTGEKKTRILFLDIAKGLAIFFMFTQHCMIIHEVNAGEGENLLANFFVLLGTAPAAPVFMLIMGIFVMNSRASLQKNLIRGLRLLLLGYFLNLLRFTIPLLIAGNSGFIYLMEETPLDMFLAVDILQLSGISIILGALIKKAINYRLFPLFIFIVLIISPLLWGKFGNNPFSSVLWGDGKNVYFPFFPWFTYPLLGMYLSQYFLNLQKMKRYFRQFSLIGVLMAIFGILIFDFFPIGDYHRSGAAIHLLIIAFVFLWLNGCYWVSQKFNTKNQIFTTLTFWSKHVTAIYFIQWVLFGWSILIFDANKQNAYFAALIGLCVLILTHFLVKNKKIQQLFALI